MVNEQAGVELPPDEAVSIALHLVNAAFAAPDMSATYQMTNVIKEVFDVLQTAYPDLDTQGVAAARFIAHLRYFFTRAQDKRSLVGVGPRYSSAVIEAYPKEHQLAQRLALLLELRLGHAVADPEIVYLTMHIARLTSNE